jgi:hypothetical protein
MTLLHLLDPLPRSYQEYKQIYHDGKGPQVTAIAPPTMPPNHMHGPPSIGGPPPYPPQPAAYLPPASHAQPPPPPAYPPPPPAYPPPLSA